MSKFLRGLAAVTMLAGVGLAGPVEAAPEKQVIDIAHSTLDFTAASFLVDAQGTFKQWQGEVMLDRDNIEASSVDVKIDASSIDTRIEKRDEHLRAADFLDVQKFPSITFKSTRIKKTGNQTFDMVGNLTLHGVTKEITLPVTIDRLQDNYSRFKAETSISRSAFGITYNSKLNPIEDNLGLKLVINVKKPDPAK